MMVRDRKTRGEARPRLARGEALLVSQSKTYWLRVARQEINQAIHFLRTPLGRGENCRLDSRFAVIVNDSVVSLGGFSLKFNLLL